jgi:hypothetical protein
MQLSGLATLRAPLTTRHPHGLPEARAGKSRDLRVQPMNDPRNPQAQLNAGRTPPTQFWRAANGEPIPNPQATPPSIMQIKITMMLEEQAQALREEKQAERPAPPPRLELAYDRDQQIDAEYTDVTDQE